MLATDLAGHLGGRSGFEIVGLTRDELDVTRPEDIGAAMSMHRQDVVVHTAAMHVDECEANPERAFALNAWATRNLARACQQADAVLVYISTGGLFGDEVRAYHEYDSVVLKTQYARSKHAGEGYVRQFCQRHFVLRLGWLYGGDAGHRKNFVVARYREGNDKPVVRSASDKHGSPTYTGDVARTISLLLDTGEYGLYHVANQGGCTRAQYVQRILHEFGLNTSVEPVDSSHFPRAARIPDCEILTSFNLGSAGVASPPSWEEALARYIHGIKGELG